MRAPRPPPRGKARRHHARHCSSMELRGWQSPHVKPCTGTVNLLPPLCHAFSLVYKQVLRGVSVLPYNKRVEICLAYRGVSLRIDLGDAKAAGVVCVLGIGFSLGTLLVYRFYHQYIRPFLEAKFPDSENTASSEEYRSLSESDSGVDGAMGNNSSGPTPAVFYSREYGVAFAKKPAAPQEKPQTGVDNVRLRRMGNPGKPTGRLGAENNGSSSLNSSLSVSPGQSDANIRTSFYSTAESGFETLPELNEDEEHGNFEEQSPSLKENFSVSSLKERNDRYFASLRGGGGGGPDETQEDAVPLLDQGGVSGDVCVPIVQTEPASSSDKSSPVRRVVDAHLLSTKSPHNQAHKNTHSDPHSNPHSEDYEDDPSLAVSESLHSCPSSGEDWSCEEEEDVSPFPSPHTAMTDSQFRQSLMQRIRHWSTFAEEYTKSPSPTPDSAAAIMTRIMKRSRSLDHHLGASTLPPPDLDLPASEPDPDQDSTIHHLETLETEFHHIQGEFQSITSKLHELIERGERHSHHPPTNTSPARRPHHLHFHPPSSNIKARQQRRRTKWERMPSVSRSDSSRSSVDLSWDCGEVGGAGDCGPAGDLHATQGLSGDGAGLNLEADGVADSEDCSQERVTSIGGPVSIVDYAAREWKGDTPKAKTITQGYHAIPDLFGCQHLRQIRGDNYCGLRSTLFQVLVGGHRVTGRWPGLMMIVDRLHHMNSEPDSGLHNWTFAGRLSCRGEEEKFAKIAQCVVSLYATIEEISTLPSEEQRLSRTLSVLNDTLHFDTELMEGLKLMMLFRANDLQREMGGGGDVPTFAWLLFARDTSSDVVNFVKNHLNCVGDSAGIDQVEMCLLGHCLGVKIRVARLDHYGQQDFECCFPDEAPPDWPSIGLLAEDDRHYNVPVA